MLRRFSIIEDVRIAYEYETTEEEEALINSEYDGDFCSYVEQTRGSTLWSSNNRPPEHVEILDYLHTSFDTIEEE